MRMDSEVGRSPGLLARYWRRSLLVTATLAAAAFVALVVLSPWDSAQQAGAQAPLQEDYVTTHSAKFLCGPMGEGPLVPGDYQTAINVHNFTPDTIWIYKKAVEAWSELEPPAIPSEWQEVVLGPDYAFEIDCEDIYYLLGYEPGGPGYLIKGFVVIGYDGTEPLVDVAPVYTATDVGVPGIGQAMDVERATAKVQEIPAPEPNWMAFYTYSAKFACGYVSGTEEPPAAVVPGLYLTAINVHNPLLDDPTFMFKKAVRAQSEFVEPQPPSPWEYYETGPDYAFEIDCYEIGSWLFPEGPWPDFFKGFVVISAPWELDVVGVYTADRYEEGGKGFALDIEEVPYTIQPAPVMP